jgi:hypothetical protein
MKIPFLFALFFLPSYFFPSKKVLSNREGFFLLIYISRIKNNYYLRRYLILSVAICKIEVLSHFRISQFSCSDILIRTA